MNYYERYCGDYQRDTAHLSLAEHGAYTMLLDTYFSVEKPLPEDLSSLYRVCRAMTRLEQQAVKSVAEQFFPVSGGDGLRHNQRADREIAKARPKIEAARINGRKGGRPAKAASANTEIRQMQPRGADIPDGLSMGFDQEPSGSRPAPYIETHGEPSGEAYQSQPHHQPQPQPHHHHQRQHELHRQSRPFREEASADFNSCGTGDPEKDQPEPEMAARQQGREQEPAPDHGSLHSRPGNRGDSRGRTGFHAGTGSLGASVAPGTAGACCKALMGQGVTGCNPHHPTLLALLQAGATEEEFLQAAGNAAARGKANFPYVVGMVRRQREEAAKLVLHQGRMPSGQKLLQAASHTGTAGWMPPELRNAPAAEPAEPGEPVEPPVGQSAAADRRVSPCG